MITKDEVQEMAHLAALHIMAFRSGPYVLTRLERLIMDAYTRGVEDGSVRAIEARTQLDFEELLGKRS